MGPPPKLGDPVIVSVKRFGFRLKEKEIIDWLKLYGAIHGHPAYVPSSTEPDLVNDTMSVKMTLKRNIPSLLPAFGKKMNVVYRGQSRLCNKCYQVGHVSANCENERVDWMTYVRDFLRSDVAPREMLGRWADFAEENVQKVPEKSGLEASA